MRIVVPAFAVLASAQEAPTFHTPAAVKGTIIMIAAGGIGLVGLHRRLR